MPPSDLPLQFDAASAASARAMPNTTVATSLTAGWTSLLLEHQLSQGRSDPFTTLATPDQTIVIATRGDHELACLSQGKWRKAIYRPGSGGMTAGGETARLRWQSRNSDGAFHTAHLYVPPGFFRDAEEHYRRLGERTRCEPLNVLSFNDPTVAQTVRGLLAAMAAGASDLYAQAAAQWLAVHLLAHHSGWIDIVGDKRTAGAISDRRLARVIDFMTAHFARPLTLAELAAEAAISKFHFVRLFREKAGSTPHAYLFQLRMAAARRMLATTDLAIGEVARGCGFTSASHFAAAFARATATTPTAYRDAARGKHRA